MIVSSFRTIPQMFFSQAARFGERRMLLVKREGVYQEIRWSEARQAVEELALFLLDDGVTAGQCVAILSENRPEWAIADLAIQSIGAIAVPIYATNTPAEVAHILADAGAVAVVISNESQLDKVLTQRSRLPQLRRLIVAESLVFPETAGIHTFAQCLERGSAVRPQRMPALQRLVETGQRDHVATFIYTSGTTGEPKGVMLTHGNFLSNCEAGRQVLSVNERDVHLSFLPLSHVFERMAGYYLMIHQGATIAYAEGMDQVPANMLDVRPTVLLGVPRFYEKLYTRVMESVSQAPPVRQRLFAWAVAIGKACEACHQAHRVPSVRLKFARAVARRLVYQKFKARLGGRVRFCVSGSAPLSREIAEFFSAVEVLILEGYGLTETSPVISANRLDAYKFGSVGQALPGVEVRIADDGEILTRGPHVMQGYYRQDAETQAALADGWFHTGDIGHLDADGFLYITDRKKDLIKTSGGKMVAPQKIENLLVTDPYIAQAFVFGDRARYLVALIVPRREALQRYAAEQGLPAEPFAALLVHPRIVGLMRQRVDARSKDLASFECIKQFALLEHEWTQTSGELTPTLKSRRAVLAQKYHDLLEQLYAAPTAAQPT